MRALEPELQGRVEVDGVGIGYEVFGSGPRTIVLAPAWAIVNSHFWKAQVPYLARRFRVVTWDTAGSGRSDRTHDPAHHSRGVRNTVAVLDATDTERALLVGLSLGAATSLFTATLHPERVAGVVAIGSTIPLLVDGPSLDGDAVRRGPRHRRGLGALDPGLMAARLPRLRRALLARDVPRAALREADRGLRRLGPRLRPRGARGDDGLAAGLRRRASRPRRWSPACAARCWRIHGDERPHLAARVRAPRRRADRRRARRPRGLRPRAQSRATRCASTC